MMRAGLERTPRRRQLACTSLASALIAIAISFVTGCDDRPPDGGLRALREEADVENLRRLAARERSGDAGTNAWSLVIEGQTTSGAKVTLSSSELQSLAVTHVRAPSETTGATVGEDVDFRGVSTARLLAQVSPEQSVTEVTFLAADGHRATLPLRVTLDYPVALAVAANGIALTRATGGPLFLVLPIRAYPELASFSWSYWVFYVTHMIVGTERLRLRAFGSELDREAFERLPQRSARLAVKYRVAWPTDAVLLKGVRISDLLAAAHIELPVGGQIVVEAKPHVWRQPQSAPRFSQQDLRECDPILVSRWGDDGAEIPARMGGPLTLALAGDCPAHREDHAWPTFVEGLHIETPAR